MKTRFTVASAQATRFTVSRSGAPIFWLESGRLTLGSLKEVDRSNMGDMIEIFFDPDKALTRFFELWRVYSWDRMARGLGIKSDADKKGATSIRSSFAGILGNDNCRRIVRRVEGKQWACDDIQALIDRRGRRGLPAQGIETAKAVAYGIARELS